MLDSERYLFALSRFTIQTLLHLNASRRLNVLGCMVSPVKTEAIVVWDIENTRVPVVLRNNCFEIVQSLVADVQERNPTSTVSKV